MFNAGTSIEDLFKNLGMDIKVDAAPVEIDPWAHMDIAGTYWGAKSNKMVGHGATGIHVRTMVRLITGE